MSSSNLRVRRAVRLASAGVAAVASTSVLSQAAVGSSDAGKDLEEIVITGTRIRASANDVSLAPVVTLTAADIAKSGMVRVEDILNSMPQFVSANNSGQSLNSDGTATLSLRGLGSERTLVLINGRRMQPGGSPANVSSADLNDIPAAMLERVDVLTGGASTTYGADALAGVVNLIMNTHFEGVRVEFYYGQNEYGQSNGFAQGRLAAAGLPVPGGFTGGQNRDWSITMGSDFADGKGNATVYATYLNTSPVVGTQLDYAACTLRSADAAPSPGQPWSPVYCGGSFTSATGEFVMLGATSAGGYSTLVDSTVDKSTGQFRPYTSADSYNYGALSYAQREAQRYTAGAFLNYDVNENINVYSETMYARNTNAAQYGPSGLFAYGEVSTSCANPLLTPSEVAALCTPANIATNQALFGDSGDRITLLVARRSVESGGRTDNYSLDSIREVIGSKGRFSDAWSYEAYGQYGISSEYDAAGGYLGTQQISNALDVVTDPATGSAVCQAALDGTDRACVPWNIWQKGGVTPEQVGYLLIPSTYDSNSTEYVVNGSVTGQLGKYGIKAPRASDPVVVNLGVEYRQESAVFVPDYVYANGLASGGNGNYPPFQGNFHVNEMFLEAKVPLLDNLPGAYHVGLEGGYRYSDYSSGFTTNTYKLGFEWAPIQDLKLRGSYNRAVRVPNIEELYSPRSQTPGGGNNDPCWGKTPKYTMAECQLTGLDPGKYGKLIPNPAGGVNAASGGNPNLSPEAADTYTVGFVLQPVALPSLVMSVDYYRIRIDNTISTSVGTDDILDVCATTGNPAVCQRIHRNPVTGSLWLVGKDFVDTTNLNIGTVTTSGYDIAARYSVRLGRMGKLGFNFIGTRVTDASSQLTPVSPSFDCAGLYGAWCGTPTPKWKHILGTDWATPWASLVLSGRWRYTGPVSVDSSSSNVVLNGPYQPGFGHIGGYDYIDMSAAVSWGENLDFRVGANNVFDKGPPIVLSGNLSNCGGCNGNTWMGTYDWLGRYIYAQVTAKF